MENELVVKTKLSQVIRSSLINFRIPFRIFHISPQRITFHRHGFCYFVLFSRNSKNICQVIVLRLALCVLFTVQLHCPLCDCDRHIPVLPTKVLRLTSQPAGLDPSAGLVWVSVVSQSSVSVAKNGTLCHNRQPNMLP